MYYYYAFHTCSPLKRCLCAEPALVSVTAIRGACFAYKPLLLGRDMVVWLAKKKINQPDKGSIYILLCNLADLFPLSLKVWRLITWHSCLLQNSRIFVALLFWVVCVIVEIMSLFEKKKKGRFYLGSCFVGWCRFINR